VPAVFVCVEQQMTKHVHRASLDTWKTPAL